MDALLVKFHGMREWNFVAREKLRVAVAGGASVGQILLGYRRSYIAGGLNLMDRSVAGEASWGVRVTRCGRFSMNALPEFLYFIGMALRALCRRQWSRGYYFVMAAMAGFASLLA